MRPTLVRIPQLAGLIFLASGYSEGQVRVEKRHDIASTVDRLTSTDPTTRQLAFSELSERDLGGGGPVIGMLRDLLLREDQVTDSINSIGLGTSEVLGESYGEYRSALAAACLKKCNRADPLVLRALANSGYDEDSQFAQTLARELGPQVTDILLVRAAGRNRMSADLALRMLGTLHEKGQGLSNTQRAKIIQLVRTRTQDHDVGLRTAAVQVLGRIGSREDIPLLEGLRQKDQATVLGKRGAVYPIRMAADKAIARIERRPK